MSLGNVNYAPGTNAQGGYMSSSQVKQFYQGGGGGNQGQLASLQNTGVPGINTIQMPSWLNTNPDANLAELTQSYANIGTAFDPTGQVKARNDAIGYNTAQGTQSANNAATEYSNRAAQSGGSQLGAGVVKAQAMLPVLSQNAALRTDAADVAAKSHQEAATLASQVAGTIGQLRQSYLSTLTGYATGQQGMQVQNQQFNQGMAMDQQKFNYMKQQNYLQQAEQQRQQQLAIAQSRQGTLAKQQPLANWNDYSQGTSRGFGMPNYTQQQGAANQQLKGMF